MGKSKKTLALVMALVMAFTIVPFGAWNILNASAEEPTAQDVATYYVPATQLRDGQYYLIASADSSHLCQHVPFSNGHEHPGNNKGAFTVTQATPFDTGVQEKLPNENLVLWQYVMDTSTDPAIGRFKMVDSTANGVTEDKYTCNGAVYLDIRNEDAAGKRQIISYYKNDNTLTIANYGDGYYSFKRADKNYYMTFENGQFVHNGDANSRVRLYEVRTNLPETIDFPIQIRDLHGDHILVDVDNSLNAAFGLSHDGNQNWAEGNYRPQLLNYAVNGKYNKTSTTEYRTGLTQPTIENHSLQYSPYTVIYVAHALRENFYGGGRGTNNILINDNPLGEKLTAKFTTNKIDGYNKIKYNSKVYDGGEIERFLLHGSIEGLITDLNDGNKKATIDAFFNEHLSDSDKDARTFLSSRGITGDSLEILMDYHKTMSHASSLTYEQIVNNNPSYDSLTAYAANSSDHGWSLPWTYWINGWAEETYNAYGASIMDVAWYMLHHFFKDTDAPASTLTGNNNNEKNLQYYSQKVDGAPTAIRLKRIMKEDGSVSYVYDSKFESNFNTANTNTPIMNTGLEQNAYNVMKDKETKFYPIDGKGFGYSNNMEGQTWENHNYGFSLQGSGTFVYQESENLFFEFEGDDDVFLYINGKRVDTVDLGGIHTQVKGRVNLKEIAKDYGLENGKAYDFDFFYLERNPIGSNFKMETNIRLTDSRFVPQKNAYTEQSCDNSTYIPYGAGVQNGKTVYYEFVATNSPTDEKGVAALSDISFNDENLGVYIGGDDVRGIDPSNYTKMSFYKETYNMTDKKWETKETGHFTDKTDIMDVVRGVTLQAGQRFFICGIPHTLDIDKDGTKFENVVNITATIAGRDPSTLPAAAVVDILNIQDKSFVVDFAGNLNFKADDLFNADDLSAQNIAVTSNGTFGTASLDGNKNLVYSMNNILNGTDTITLTETFKSIPYNDEMDGTPYTYNCTAEKHINIVPANNVYYDAGFQGITYSDNWKTATKVGESLLGVTGGNVVYGQAGEEVKMTDRVIHYVEGTGAVEEVSFTVKGTGITVYMDTNADSGNIYAITKDTTTDKSLIDRTIIKSDNPLKEVPVINHVNMSAEPHEYEVTIRVSVPQGKVAALNAIRVYNPMGKDGDKFYIDSEKDAQFYELRDNLVSASTVLEGNNIDFGALYVDKGTHTANDLTDYTKIGPKDEIYLDKGQSIAFKVNTTKPNLQVSARSVKVGGDVQLAYYGGVQIISSTVDQYFNIVANPDNGIVTITNTGADVLALTNLKVSGEDARNFKMMMSRAIAEEAIEQINNPVEPETPDVPETPEEPETPSKPQSPIQKFFEDVRNFFNKLFGKH